MALIKSGDFKDKLGENLGAMLTTPGTTTYITLTSKNIIVFIMEHPDIFGLKKEFLEVQDFAVKLRPLIKKLLSNLCGNIKSKIFLSLKPIPMSKNPSAKPLPINKLANTLLPKNVGESTIAHWICFAFLHKCTVAFEEVLANQEKQKLLEHSSAGSVSTSASGKTSNNIPLSSSSSASSSSEANSAGVNEEDEDNNNSEEPNNAATAREHVWKPSQY
uniref:Uncharacterized protein n=1 Tax=Moniliophthora roreri TaxID=221103 RepID=A0A0W0G624_MONRR